jgi:CRISPR/Cas system CSM-associated protein Csm2 small subunit
MRKKCEKCGKEFEPRQPHFRMCPNCYSPQKKFTLSSSLLLKAYFDSEGNFLKEVFIGTPEIIADILAKDNLAIKQLRDFHQIILKARNKALLHGINTARSILYGCRRDIGYQLKRNVIPQSFSQFMEYHLELAEKNEEMLDGFLQHLESIVAYYPK